jgi:hypothetical protein
LTSFFAFLLSAAAVLPVRAEDTGESLTVAVLGDSRTDGCVGRKNFRDCRLHDSGFNEPVLAALLGLVAKKHPAGVFFTGDLTLGLEKEEDDGEVAAGSFPASAGWARNFEYDPKGFARMLAVFKKTVAQQLGSIPFHAVVGNHDTVGPDAITTFRRVFGLQHPPGGYTEPSHLAYTITIGNAVFVVLATDYYQPCPLRSLSTAGCNLQDHLVSQPQLAWLDGQLAQHAGKYLFVVGHEPAFSSGSAKTGLDFNEASRNAFWKILKARGVTAYLCSHQHQFEASPHEGIWQVISGGAGAPLDGNLKGTSGAPAAQCTGGIQIHPDYVDHSYFHYLLLHIPKTPGGVVSVEVRDCTDSVRRTLDLTPKP